MARGVGRETQRWLVVSLLGSSLGLATLAVVLVLRPLSAEGDGGVDSIPCSVSPDAFIVDPANPCPRSPTSARTCSTEKLSRMSGRLSDPLVTTTPDDFLVMLIGDGGVLTSSRDLLALAATEGVDMIIHAGDFDYLNDPLTWDAMITEELGANFPYFGVIGNHDISAWLGYEDVLLSRLARLDGVMCEKDGLLGVRSWCMYRGVLFVGTGVGTMCVGPEDENYHEDYLANVLPAMYGTTPWRFCVWHKNQHLMQTGYKQDEVGWDAYELCRQHGYIIQTGHEHSYSRSHAISKFDATGATVASVNNMIDVYPGQTFAFVSGLGGRSYRSSQAFLRAQPWWGSVYAREDDATGGALFCLLNPSGEQGVANCFFKNIRGEVIDTFSVRMQ